MWGLDFKIERRLSSYYLPQRTSFVWKTLCKWEPGWNWTDCSFRCWKVLYHHRHMNPLEHNGGNMNSPNCSDKSLNIHGISNPDVVWDIVCPSELLHKSLFTFSPAETKCSLTVRGRSPDVSPRVFKTLARIMEETEKTPVPFVHFLSWQSVQLK